MQVEILISTTNRNDVDFCTKMFRSVNDKFYKIVVINQCYTIGVPLIETESDQLKCISVQDKGLSKSRNMAIQNANGDICAIADDDLMYLPNCVETILTEYEKDEKLDVAIFQVITPEGEPYKAYSPSSFLVKNPWDQYRVSSVEITFRRKSIVDNTIAFNENLGLGAKYTSGEEALFIHDCVKKGLKVKYFPIPIVEHPKESSGKVYSEGNALARGIVFAKLFPFRFLLFDLYFSLKWYPKYKKQFGYFKYLGWMLKGNWIVLTNNI